MEDRVTELESRLAFQEHTITSLNDIVTEQQQKLELLQEQVKYLYQQLQQVADSVARPAEDEPPPPHY